MYPYIFGQHLVVIRDKYMNMYTYGRWETGEKHAKHLVKYQHNMEDGHNKIMSFSTSIKTRFK